MSRAVGAAGPVCRTRVRRPAAREPRACAVPPRPPALRAALGALLSGALGAGCAHHVPLVVDPVGAYVSVGGERVGVAPLDVPFGTFGSRRLTVELTGYRTLELRLPLFLPPAVEVHLVPEHGGAGTWDPEDAE